jgi:hypothetical protein
MVRKAEAAGIRVVQLTGNEWMEPSYSVQLPRASAAWGTPGFEDALLTELYENVGDLPTELLTEEGGLPDDEDIRLDSAVLNGNTVEIGLTVWFIEQVGTGCQDILIPRQRQGCLVAYLDLETSEALVEVVWPAPARLTST